MLDVCVSTLLFPVFLFSLFFSSLFFRRLGLHLPSPQRVSRNFNKRQSVYNDQYIYYGLSHTIFDFFSISCTFFPRHWLRIFFSLDFFFNTHFSTVGRMRRWLKKGPFRMPWPGRFVTTNNTWNLLSSDVTYLSFSERFRKIPIFERTILYSIIDRPLSIALIYNSIFLAPNATRRNQTGKSTCS